MKPNVGQSEMWWPETSNHANEKSFFGKSLVSYYTYPVMKSNNSTQIVIIEKNNEILPEKPPAI